MKFWRMLPGAEVQVMEEPYEQLLSHLRAGNIDFLFSVLRRPDWATDVTRTFAVSRTQSSDFRTSIRRSVTRTQV
jgi:hypothetical protein